MPNPENLAPSWKKGQSGNPAGKPKGKRNRSTIAREVLEMTAKFPDNVWIKLKEQYPGIVKKMTVEEMMAIVQADKAIRKQDTHAYKVLMDSAYGKAKQEMDISSSGNTVTPLNIIVRSEEAKKAIESL